ncbi:hypothetical protein [Phycicoccus avicenniae]|uniref:hypothetical protein n=1 Tax=Phycicoccus avicenniae TaxID=2828860 RepID=UPI003D266AB6
MNDSMQQTQNEHLSTATQMDDQPSGNPPFAWSGRVGWFLADVAGCLQRRAHSVTRGMTPTKQTDASTRVAAAWRLGLLDGIKHAQATLQGCPPWCNDHRFANPLSETSDEDSWHQRAAWVGDDKFEIAIEENGPTMWLPQAEGVPLPMAREWISAMQRVVDEFERLSR